jgi:hypothetical protein
MSCPEPALPTAPDSGQASNGGAGHPPTADLFAGVLGVFKARGFSEESALPAVYFAFSTWFSAFLPVAPCLLVAGAGPEARLLLGLLECVVHNPLPLFGLTRGGFLSIDTDSEPTLLVDQEGISEPLWRLLRASNHRNAQVPGASGVQKIYCAKGIYLGNESNDLGIGDSVLRISLSPLRGRLPILEADEKKDLGAEFQVKMQAYRQRNLVQVRDSRFDLPEFSSAIRILARVLGAPIVAAPELQVAVGTLLRDYEESIRAALWVDPRCVVIEAVLFHSHDDRTERVYIGEITGTANAILKGRGESMQLGAKEAGAIVRNLGLSPKRDRKGYSIRLDDSIRRHIHQLASRFAVATLQEGAMLCAHCAEFCAFEAGSEGHMLSMK